MFTYYPYFNPEITHLTILMYAKNASKTPTIKHLTYECPLLLEAMLHVRKEKSELFLCIIAFWLTDGLTPHLM